MASIETLNGHSVEVDDEDLASVSPFRWTGMRMGRHQEITYVATTVDRKTVYMHRYLMGAGPGVEVDHRDGNGLNNRRSNLRCATHALNLANQRPQVGRSSRFKGVSRVQRTGRWEAYIKVDQKKRALGVFVDEAEAAKAYDVAAVDAWGEFARTNF